MERTTFKTLAVATLLAAFSISSFAAPVPPNDSLVQLTSLGVQEGEMVFKIKTANLSQDKLYVVINDSDGLNIYKGIFSEKNLSKTFKVPAELGSLTLVITNLKDKNVERYEIANEKKTIEELVITTVK